jgi:hypothetical protein
VALAAGHLGARGAPRKVGPGKAGRAGPAVGAHDPGTEKAGHEVEAWPRPLAGPEAVGNGQDRPGRAGRGVKARVPEARVPGARDKLDGPRNQVGARPEPAVARLTGARRALRVKWLTATGARTALPVTWLTATGAHQTVAMASVASPGPTPLPGAIPLGVLGTSAGPRPHAALAARARPRPPGARVTSVLGDLLLAAALAANRSDAQRSQGRVLAAPPEEEQAELLGLTLRSLRSARYPLGGGA